MTEGKILKIISNVMIVTNNNKNYSCKCIGRFRYENIYPLVGDKVIFNINDKVISEILPRRNSLIRPPISNVDQAIIVASCKRPAFSSNLLDKLLNIIEYCNIKPIICLTKLDLLNDSEKEKIDIYTKYYEKIGYKVIKNTDYDKLLETIKNKTSVLAGQTGVGKSTLLNKLKPGLKLATKEISEALGRGKHTTRHVELLEIGEGLVADTPGFSALDLTDMSKKDIRDNFVEFHKYSSKCFYNDCSHIKEDRCNIKKLVEEGTILKSRYNNYIKFINNIEEVKWK